MIHIACIIATFVGLALNKHNFAQKNLQSKNYYYFQAHRTFSIKLLLFMLEYALKIDFK